MKNINQRNKVLFKLQNIWAKFLGEAKKATDEPYRENQIPRAQYGGTQTAHASDCASNSRSVAYVNYKIIISLSGLTEHGRYPGFHQCREKSNHDV